MQTDNEWVDIIKQTLNDYQEDYIPGSWERFADKQKKRRRIIYMGWTSGLAASFLLGWFAITWIFQNNHQPTDMQMVKNSTIQIEPNQTIISDSNQIQPIDQGLKKVKSGLHFASNKPANTHSSIIKNENKTTDTNSYSKTEIAENSPLTKQEQMPEADIELQNTGSSLIAKEQDEEKTATQENTNQPVKILDQKAIDSALNAYTQPLVELNDDNNNDQTERKVRFGVNLSPGVNATQTAAAMNYAGGLNTDIDLFANIQLSTGLQIEQQNINTQTDAQGTPSNEVRAELLTLDLPINITWRFYSGKSHSYYVSGGVSSMAYLDQKYENTTYEFKIRETITSDANKYEMTEEETTEETQLQPFETFDFAGRVNIVFGLEQKLTPKLFLHVEPYLKIPVGGLGAEKMKFTTSGITCKVSF